MSSNVDLIPNSEILNENVNNDPVLKNEDGTTNQQINNTSIDTSDKNIPQKSNLANENLSINEIAADNKDYPQDAKYVICFLDKEIGYINSDGNIIQKSNAFFAGHSVGRIKDNYQREAVAFYCQRFNELNSKFERFEEELRSGQFKPNFLDKIRELNEFIPVSPALGDFEKLINDLKKLESESIDRFAKNLEQKKQLCLQVEKLSDSINWKETTDEIKKLQEAWKAVGPVAPEHSDTLWNTFRGSIDKFFERLRLHYEELEKERTENYRKKEELCLKAESLSSSTDWKNTNEELKKLQIEWKKIGPVPILQSDMIWSRFRVAQDKFYERLKAHYDKLDEERGENLKKKEELCVIAESYIESTSWRKTAGDLKKLQEQWKLIGPAPQEHSEVVWTRFKSAMDKFYERFRRHMEEVDAERKINFEKKEQLCLQAEALAKSTSWNETSESLKKLQMEWREIGPAPDNVSQQIWERFRKAMDEFFERRREFFVQRSKALKQKSETWQTRIRETLFRKNEQLSRLKDLIKLDEQNMEKLKDQLSKLSESVDLEEKKSLQIKFTEVENSFNSKLEKLKEYEESIKDIESKL